ncbi:MAG: aminopeptidase P family protein [Clostridiales bacterium]|jgi:Xaa-Pro aminopeptidase|nr:aminopeptidase P family protein [Clostridiales bacterium]
MLDLKCGADTIVLLHSDNRFFYSNVHTSYGALILNDKQNIFITDSRYTSFAHENVKDFKVVIVEQGGDLYGIIASECMQLQSKVIGYEEFTITKNSFDKLQSVLGMELVPVGEYLSQERAVKKEHMIGNMRDAQKIAEKALDRVKSLLKPGITERDVAIELYFEMVKLGASGTSFSSIVAFGENSAYPHHTPTYRKLKKNDMILIDMGALYNGYCSDMTRTFCIGEVCEEMVKAFHAVKSAQEIAMRGIKAGVSCKDIDNLARESLRANGYGDKFVHSTGHGIGVAVHEYPRISQSSQDILQEGNVVTIEPGVYIGGVGGVRIEDMVLVNSNGFENLTKFKKDLML